MSFGQFKDQLRRNFKIRLTPSQFGSLCNLYRGSKEGFIDCDNFVFQFLRIGREEREREHQLRVSLNHKIIKKQQSEIFLHDGVSIYSKEGLSRQGIPSEDDRKSALEKIRIAACHFDPYRHVGLKPFQAQYLESTVFREQMKLNFDVHLTPLELKALLTLFDKRGDGNICCSEFVSAFNRFAVEERLRLESVQHVHQARREDKKEALRQQIEEDVRRRRETHVLWPLLPRDDDAEEGGDNASSGDGEAEDSKVSQLRRSRHSSAGDSTGSLPPIFQVQPWSAPSSSGNGGGRQSSSSPSGRNRTLRKAPTRGSLYPTERTSRLNKKRVSLAEMFPKASEDVKVSDEWIGEKRLELTLLH